MKNLIRSISLLCVIFSMASAEAKTFKYDLAQINSRQGSVHYNGLDFSHASSAIITVVKTPPSTESKLTVEINFPHAAKLFASNFKAVDDSKYRAIVSDVWIYKEVIVEVDTLPLAINRPVRVQVFVSERAAFNNPVTDNQPNMEALLFELSGQMRDITPTRTIDTLTSTIYNKRINLYLKDRLASNDFTPSSAVIEATWYGKGTKMLHVPISVPWTEFDEIEVIGFTLQGPVEDPLVVVKYKNVNDDSERLTTPITVQELLGRAYGPSAFQ